MAEWFYNKNGKDVGPLSNREFLEKVKSGAISESTLVRKDNAKWVKAVTVGGLFDAVDRGKSKLVCPYCGGAMATTTGTCNQCYREVSVAIKTDNQVSQSVTRSKETVAEKLKASETFSEGYVEENERMRIVAFLYSIGAVMILPILALTFSQGGVDNIMVICLFIFMVLVLALAGFLHRRENKRQQQGHQGSADF